MHAAVSRILPRGNDPCRFAQLQQIIVIQQRGRVVDNANGSYIIKRTSIFGDEHVARVCAGNNNLFKKLPLVCLY